MNSPIVVTDTLTADHALRLIHQGSRLLWEGDFQNAKQLLTALDRRLKPPPARTFHQHRRQQSSRAQVLNSLLIAIDDQYCVPLRRAPDLRTACLEAYGPAAGPSLVPLRELLGVAGAHQWRQRGIPIPALGDRIHPYYGVFAPTRSEYVDLVATADLPGAAGTAELPGAAPTAGVPGVVGTAFDIGTGSRSARRRSRAARGRAGDRHGHQPPGGRLRERQPAAPWARRSGDVCSRRICSLTAGPISSSAIRPGSRLARSPCSITRSTTRTAGCCAASWLGSPTTCVRTARPG